MKYDFASIEQKWRDYWDREQTFRTPNPGDPPDAGFDPDKPKFYVLDMFPYPSGVGLHVGHPLGYIATDILGRYKLMRGFNVLHPMGYDAFGLPAEQYAVEHNVHPRITTEKNIANMTAQLKRLGMGYDWSRCFATTDPGYVKWTQWIFLQLYHSYFDPIENKAMPIAHLIHQLEQQNYYVGIDGELINSADTENLEALSGIGDPNVHKWHELDPGQQARLLDEYRLAYMDDVEVNWCPRLGTVLANEEVTNDGRSERGNFPVYKRPLKQWMLRITAYCDRLIDGLDDIDWPESIKLLQRNWIGKSLGARVDFAVDGTDDASITVFTTRPDTLFGATYMVLAPEHPLVGEITTDAQLDAVEAYQRRAESRSSVDRQADAKEKTGVFTGAYAVNPVNDQAIPIWIADYVMMGYGTGAIMAVPAHDERDYAFARTFDLPIVEVVSGGDVSKEAYTGNGPLIHSANDEVSLNGLPVDEAKQRITGWLEARQLGWSQTQYRLRDWLFSRQRYWGEPFPILHGPHGEIRPVDEADLPVELPEMDDFKPHGTDDPDAPPQPPLGRAGDEWKKVTIDGVEYTRELNTMPNWAGSCWYYLRYLDPQNKDALVGREAERYWMLSKKKDGSHHAGGIDLYIGGPEHAVLHLLYFRFWHQVLYDLGHVSTPEPAGRYFAQGYIQAFYYEDAKGVRVPAADVIDQKSNQPAMELQDKDEKELELVYEGRPVKRQYGKMGKSLKNAIDPVEVMDRYGCDTLRLYEMYLGPLEASKTWNTQDIVGVHRFLQRVWRNFYDADNGGLLIDEQAPDEATLRLLHKTIQRVTDAMESMGFNVAIAALIELNNALVKLDKLPRVVAESFVKMLAPFAPHVAEELWAVLGQAPSVAHRDWPAYDPALLVEDTIELPVQVNGKLRGKVTVAADADDSAIEAAARADPNVAVQLDGKTVRKVIVIPKRLVNIVAS